VRRNATLPPSPTGPLHFGSLVATLGSHCACSRREIAANGLPGIESPVYPGTCRHRLPPGKRPRSLRLRIGHGTILVPRPGPGSAAPGPGPQSGRLRSAPRGRHPCLSARRGRTGLDSTTLL